MTTGQSQAGSRSWLGVVVVASAACAVDVAGLALHPEFEPVYTLRTAAPAFALILGAAFTHRVAARRAQVDVPGEFDPGGRALFLGFVMVAATLLAWVLAAQAVPSLLNAAVGTPRSEAAVLFEKPAGGADPACPHRLVVTSESLPRPLDDCVAQPVWDGASVGATVTIDLRASLLGAELRGVRPAGGAGALLGHAVNLS